MLNQGLCLNIQQWCAHRLCAFIGWHLHKLLKRFTFYALFLHFCVLFAFLIKRGRSKRDIKKDRERKRERERERERDERGMVRFKWSKRGWKILTVKNAFANRFGVIVGVEGLKNGRKSQAFILILTRFEWTQVFLAKDPQKMIFIICPFDPHQQATKHS